MLPNLSSESENIATVTAPAKYWSISKNKKIYLMRSKSKLNSSSTEF